MSQVVSSWKMPVLLVKYYCSRVLTFTMEGTRDVYRDVYRDGGYMWMYKVVGAGAGFWNNNGGAMKIYGQGPKPVSMRYFASPGIYFYRWDCSRDARRFSRKHGVRVMLLCLPMPVKFGSADFHLTVVRVREHRRAVTIRWMLGAGYPFEVAECIAEFLVGRKFTKLSYSAWLCFN